MSRSYARSIATHRDLQQTGYATVPCDQVFNPTINCQPIASKWGGTVIAMCFFFLLQISLLARNRWVWPSFGVSLARLAPVLSRGRCATTQQQQKRGKDLCIKRAFTHVMRMAFAAQGIDLGCREGEEWKTSGTVPRFHCLLESRNPHVIPCWG